MDIREDVIKRIQFVIPPEEYEKRVNVTFKGHKEINVRIDLHGLTVPAAQRLVNNLINIVQVPFILHLVHGYRSGTEIKDYVRKDLDNGRVLKKYTDIHNPGTTTLKVK